MGLPAAGPRSAASGGHGTNREESTLVSQQQRENRSFFGITYQNGIHVTAFVPKRLIPPKISFPFSETMVL